MTEARSVTRERQRKAAIAAINLSMATRLARYWYAGQLNDTAIAKEARRIARDPNLNHIYLDEVRTGDMRRHEERNSVSAIFRGTK